MLLENKTAIVYGSAGAIGSAVARAYAREGAHVHLAGRTIPTLEGVSETIRNAGGTADIAQVDVLDQAALERHTADIAATEGSIEICFNATSNDDIQGRTVLDMRFDELMQPVTKSLTAHFNIATSVARHMAHGRGGVILVMAGGREAIPRLGGSHVAWAGLAGLSRQLAADLGHHGIRVVWLLSPGSPGSDHDYATPEPVDQPQPEPAPGIEGLLPGTSPPTRR